MALTLEQARQIVANTRSYSPLSGPAPQEDGENPFGGDTGGGTDTSGGDVTPPSFDQSGGDQYTGALQDAVNRVNSGNYSVNDVYLLKDAGLITATKSSSLLTGASSSGTSGSSGSTGGTKSGGSSSFDTGPGYLNLAGQQFGASENQRGIENAMNFQQLLNSQKMMDQNIMEQNRQFGRQEIGENRADLGNRANLGLGAGSLGLNLAQFNAEQANSPSNFPGYLAGLAGAQPGGTPALTQLLGNNFQIEGAPSPLQDPKYQAMYNSLLNYGTVPDPGRAGDVQVAYDQNPQAAQTFFSQDPANLERMFAGGQQPNPVTQAYQQDPNAAQTFFSQKPEDLQRMFGTKPMAQGGTLWADKMDPVTINDMKTQTPLAMAGEAGPEQISVSPGAPRGLPTGTPYAPGLPQTAPPPAQMGNSYTPAEGTSVALGNALRPLGSVPKPILDTLGAGGALTPNVIGILLSNPNLPPSLRQLLEASIRSRVGEAGLQDTQFQTNQYQLPGLGYGQSYVSH